MKTQYSDSTSTHHGATEADPLETAVKALNQALSGPVEEADQQRIRTLIAQLAEIVLNISVEELANEDDPAFLESLQIVQVQAAVQAATGCQLSLESFIDGFLPSVAADTLIAAARELGAAAEGGHEGPEPHTSAYITAEPFGLTDLQEAYLLGQDEGYELGGVTPGIYLELRLPALDSARLDAAVNGVVRHHPMLRARLAGRHAQRVLSDVPDYHVPITVADVDTERDLAAIAAELTTRRPGDDDPLFAFRATLLPDGSAVLHCWLHLLIADGVSTAILLDELAERYLDPDRTWAEPGVSFRDYQTALERQEQSARYEAAREYWLSRIDTLPTAPDLPLAMPLSAVGVPQFGQRSFRLGAKAWSSLRGKAHEADISPTATVATAFARVLSRWSASEHFTINVTVNDRIPIHRDINEVFGDFTALNLLEVKLDTAGSFATDARAVQRQLWADLDRREFSGVRVLRELARRRGPGRAIMPVVFTMAAGSEPRPSRLDEFAESLQHLSAITPQTSLECRVVDLEGGLLVCWDFVPAAFPPGLVDAMFEAFRTLVTGLAEDDGSWHAAVSADLPASQEQVRTAVNDTVAPKPDVLLHELGPHLAARSERVAVVGERSSLTYGDLDRRATRVARRLRDLDARPNELVAVVMHRGWEEIVATVGVSYSGAAYLPIDAGLPPARIRHLMERGEVRFVLTQSDVADGLPLPDGVRSFAVDDDAVWDKVPDEPLPVLARPSDLAYVIFTSGSTGEPKGVMLTHAAAGNTIVDINRRFGLTDEDRVLALSALNFDLSVWDVFGTLAAGGTIVQPHADGLRDPRHWRDLLHRHRVTAWNSVPALMDMLVGYLAGAPGRRELPDLRLVMLSGDWIPVSLPERIRALATSAEVISLGGATEGAIWSIFHPIDQVDAEWRSIPYGKPLANQAFDILDRAGRPAPDWVPGELCIVGAGVAEGYWRDADRTCAVFMRHPRTGEPMYRTGDLGRYHPDGTIEFLGRTDHQVKINGYRIELGEIENTLLRHPAVADVVVAAHANRITAGVVSDPQSGATEADLIDHCRSTLPNYMVPNALVFLAAIPVTANGKVDRAAVIAAAGAAGTGSGAVADSEPTTAYERHLATLWKAVLGDVPVHRGSDFFQLGGDSVGAVRLIAAAEQQGTALSVADVLSHPVLSDMAQVLADRAGQTARGPVLTPESAPESAFEPFPLSDLQQAYLLGRQTGRTLGDVAALHAKLTCTGLDAARLEDCLAALVDRHPMLRAVVEPDGTQRVLADVPRYRIQTVPPWTPDEGAFLPLQDPAQWPLFRASVRADDEQTTSVFLTLDLLIADGASAEMFLHELATVYADGELGAPAAATFRDYQLMVAAENGSERHETARRYWLDRVDALPAAPALPRVADPAAVAAPSFTRRRHTVPAELWAALGEKASARSLTRSACLTAAYAHTLAQWSDSASFTLSLTVNDRLPVHPDVNRVFGPFTAVELLQVDLDPEAGFTADASNLLRRLGQDLEHRAFSGIGVIRELGRRRGPQAALMPVVLTSVLDEPAAGDDRVTELGWRVDSQVRTPQVLLDARLRADGGALEIEWNSIDEVLDASVVAEMFEVFCRQVEALATDESAWTRAVAVAAAGPRAAAPTVAVTARGTMTAPRNDIEERLLKIWRDVLSLDAAGVEDDFGASGGDSMLALQFVARAADEGITITAADMMAHPTVAALAAVAVGRSVPRASRGDQEEAAQEQRLLPRHLDFLDQPRSNAARWNYALLLDVETPLDRVALTVAVRQVLRTHEGLRLGFVATDEGWRSRLAEVKGMEVPVTWVDLRGLAPAEAEERRLAACQQAHDSFVLDRPPLFRIVYFATDRPGKDQIFLCAHWLAMDNYSVRIVLGDILSAHAQILEEGEATLTPAVPIGAAVRAAYDLVGSSKAAGEIEYWHRAITTRDRRAARRQDRRPSRPVRLSALLSAETSADVLAGRYGDPEVVLLGALAHGYAPLAKDSVLDVDVDSHGRRRFGAALDVSRCVGRLSARYPVDVSLRQGTDLLTLIEAADNAAGSVPAGGEHWELLAYLADPPLDEAVPGWGSVLFNYIGSMDALWALDGLSPADGPTGERDTAGDGDRYDLDVLIGHVGGHIVIGATADLERIDAKSADQVLDVMTGGLEALGGRPRFDPTPDAVPASANALRRSFLNE